MTIFYTYFVKYQILNNLQQQDADQHLMYAGYVDCSNLGLTALPDKLPMNTHHLNVSNNNVSFFLYKRM